MVPPTSYTNIEWRKHLAEPSNIRIGNSCTCTQKSPLTKTGQNEAQRFQIPISQILESALESLVDSGRRMVSRTTETGLAACQTLIASNCMHRKPTMHQGGLCGSVISYSIMTVTFNVQQRSEAGRRFLFSRKSATNLLYKRVACLLLSGRFVSAWHDSRLACIWADATRQCNGKLSILIEALGLIACRVCNLIRH